MRTESGFTLIELITYLSLASIAMFTGYTLWASSELTNRRHTDAFNRHAAVAATLHVTADDLRDSVRIAPRGSGPGGVIFMRDGRVIVYYDRADIPGAIYRKVVRGSEGELPKVVARRVTGLTFTEDDGVLTARATAGDESRAISVRRRP